jgi:hypothetical protein
MSVLAKLQFSQSTTTFPADAAAEVAVAVPVVARSVSSGSIARLRWTLLSAPTASALVAGVLAVDVPETAFTPDVAGGYLIELEVIDRDGFRSTTRKAVLIPEASGRIIPPFLGDPSSLNVGGQTRGWSPYLEEYLKAVDSGAGSGGGVVTTASQLWSPPGAGLLAQDASAAVVSTNDATEISITFPWGLGNVVPTNGVIKASAEVLAKYKGGGDFATFDISASFVVRAGVVTYPLASPSLDRMVSDGAKAALWTAYLDWDAGTNRPKVVVAGSAGDIVEWCASIVLTRLPTSAEVVPPFSYDTLGWQFDLDGDGTNATRVPHYVGSGTTIDFVAVAGAASKGPVDVADPTHDPYSNSADQLWTVPASIVDDFLAPDAFTLMAVLNIPSVIVGGTEFHDVPRLIGTGGGGAYWGLGVYDNAGTPIYMGGLFDGGFKHVTTPVPAGYHVLTWRFAGGNLQMKINDGAWSTLAGVGSIADRTNYANNESSTARAPAYLKRLSIMDRGLSDGEVTSAVSALRSTYNIP